LPAVGVVPGVPGTSTGKSVFVVVEPVDGADCVVVTEPGSRSAKATSGVAMRATPATATAATPHILFAHRSRSSLSDA
jgi:hypothetical protein